MKKYYILLILVAVIFSSGANGYAERQLLDRIVAVVNGDAVTQSELDTMLRPIFEELKKEYDGPELYKQLSDIRIKLLNQLIEDRLVFQKAKEMEIKSDEVEVDNMLKEFKSRFANEAEMEEVLADQGMTLKTIRERLDRQFMVRQLHDMEIRSKVVVSPLEIQNYYEKHPEEFTKKDRLKIRSITIKKSEEAREKGLKDEESWEAIQELQEKVRRGDDFGALAKEFSEDIHAEEGGLGNWIERGEMIPAIDEVIFNLEKGGISEIIETAMGYHFFRVEERENGNKLELEAVRDHIYGYLFQKKSEERFTEWMNELKSTAYISIR